MELRLTPRQRDVIELKALGYPMKQISDKLFISIDTVNDHIRKAVSMNEADNSVHLCCKYAAKNPDLFIKVIHERRTKRMYHHD